MKKLESMAEQAADPQIDLNELLKLDFEFYVAMTHAGRNRVMQLLINTIRSAVTVVRAVLRAVQPAGDGGAQAPPRSHQGHLGSNDGDAASKIADGYLKKGTEQFLATVRPAANGTSS